MSGNRLRAHADSGCGTKTQRAAAWTRIAQLFSICARDLRRAIAQHAVLCDLTDTEFLLLFACREVIGDGLAQQDIAEALGLSPGQISGLVDRLCQRGLVQHRRSPNDRRRQLWSLTDEGRRLLQSSLEQFNPLAGEFDRRLSSAASDEVELLVARVSQSIQQASEANSSTGDGRGGDRRHLHRKAS